MAKKGEESLAENLEWVDTLSFDELAKIKEAVTEKMDSLKWEVRDKLKADLERQLSLYGFTPEDLGFGETKSRKSGDRKRAAPTGPCPVCDFSTSPPHDGRKHRSQGESKKPFSKAELDELGLARVD